MVTDPLFYRIFEEIQTMLQIHDIRESRVWQEAKEEGKEEGLKEGIEKGIEKGKEEGIAFSVQKLAAKKMPAEVIAALLELNLVRVRQIIEGMGST